MMSRATVEAGAESLEQRGAQAAEREACGSPPTCFLAGTLVLLGDHTTEEAIEDIHVGQRVATDGGVANSADGKAKAADPNATEVDPATWRLVNLEIYALTAEGGIDVMQVQELMPLALLETEHAQAGGNIPVPLDLGDINEVGQGAIVESIEPCPQIESGPGRVVLTTITHLNDYAFYLTLADASGRTETIGITGFHKMYTEDRGWTSADDLMMGEQIRGAHGDLIVANLTRDFGVHRVYNMTVEADHVYFVGELTATSHNIDDCGADELARWEGEGGALGPEEPVVPEEYPLAPEPPPQAPTPIGELGYGPVDAVNAPGEIPPFDPQAPRFTWPPDGDGFFRGGFEPWEFN